MHSRDCLVPHMLLVLCSLSRRNVFVSLKKLTFNSKQFQICGMCAGGRRRSTSSVIVNGSAHPTKLTNKYHELKSVI